MGEQNLIKYQDESTKVSKVSVSLINSFPSILIFFQSNALSSGLPFEFKSIFSGNFTGKLSFGIGKTSTATYAPGIVDQVRIFDTVLSASQVRELQRGYYPGTPSNITYPNGVFNKAASFNGSSSKISLGNQTFFKIKTPVI